jgi:pimeloyl-ACP methyl ester carboxylesterase
MTKLHTIVYSLLLLFSPMLSQGTFAQGAKDYDWTDKETGKSKVEELRNDFNDLDSPQSTVRLKHKTMRLNGKSQPPPPPNCSEAECFTLYYFTGEHFDTNSKNRRNILYIPGGPGEISTKENRMRFLEVDNNVVYLHPRGVGLSQIPKSNSYDKFLRAEYIVEDIDQLRTEILGPKGKWDAIYGFSYGTLIAQRYAWAKHDNVHRLILSAPVVRYIDTDKARSSVLRLNLEKIYSLIRSKDSAPCDCANRNLKVGVIGRGPGLENIEATDNFCFLKPTPTAHLIDNIQEVYDKLVDEYGAIGFVTANYDDLKNDDDFKEHFPYPKEFFFALSQLQTHGAPRTEAFSLTSDNLRNMVDSAMVLGYYASLTRAELLKLRDDHFPSCQPNAPFLTGAPLQKCERNKTYCNRVDEAEKSFKEAKGTKFPRALYVFGVSDGMDQWISRMLKEDGIHVRDEGCPTGEDLLKFANGSSPNHKFLRKRAQKIGIVPGDAYCLWNPAKFRHDVQTLVLTGGADAVTAGCQAEDFFNNGLADGKRVLVEFPVMGHMFDIQFIILPALPRTSEGNAITQLVEDFLTMSVDTYRQAKKTKEQLVTLHAEDRTPKAGVPLKCQVQGKG